LFHGFDTERFGQHDCLMSVEAPRWEIGWSEFGELCRQLALDVYRAGQSMQLPGGRFDAVVGIARGGAIVGTTLAFMLNHEYFPIRLAKRGGVIRVLVPPTRDLADKHVLLVDDLSRTGETFKIAMHELRRVSARSITTCALVRREPGFKPDIAARTASAADKVVFPWGREMLVDGKFEPRRL
jgi:hypoxanthine phosphoribosyltransferase